MIQKLNLPVSVVLAFDSTTRRVAPIRVSWNNRHFLINKIGYHHTHREGETLFHTFSVVSNSTFFRLSLNTQNLFWILEEISDGEGA